MTCRTYLVFQLLLLGGIMTQVNTDPHANATQSETHSTWQRKPIISEENDEIRGSGEKIKNGGIKSIMGVKDFDHYETCFDIRNIEFNGTDRIFIGSSECDVKPKLIFTTFCCLQSMNFQEQSTISIFSDKRELKDVVDVGLSIYSKWNDPRSWADGAVPREGHQVVIPGNQNLIITSPIQDLGKLIIKGTLTFLDVPGLNLRAEQIILDHGEFLVGDSENFFQNNLEIILKNNDVHEKSIICVKCKIQIYGEVKTNMTSLGRKGHSQTEDYSEKPAQIKYDLFKNHIPKNNTKTHPIIKENNSFFDSSFTVKMFLELPNSNYESELSILLMDDTPSSSITLKHCNGQIIPWRMSRNERFDEDFNKYGVGNWRRLEETQTKYWNEPESWANSRIPDGTQDEVLIEAGTHLVLNVNTPVLKHLKIHGILTFDESVDDLELNANIIEIMDGGELRIGISEDETYKKKAKIVLHGSEEDPKVEVPGYGQVNKAIINKGRFRVYGRYRFNYISLNNDVHKSNSKIRLTSKDHNWEVGEKLLLPSSTRKSEEYEEVTIKQINDYEITLNESFEFYHKKRKYFVLADNLWSGYWTPFYVHSVMRDVVIEGSGSGEHGCLILTPGFTSELTPNPTKIEGDLSLYNVEIRNCGQYNLKHAALIMSDNASRSGIYNSVFHNIFGTAFMARRTSNFKLYYSLIYKPIEKAVQIENCSNIEIYNNTVIGVQSGGNVSTPKDVRVNFGIVVSNELTLDEAGLQMKNNLISSIQDFGIGYLAPGFSCSKSNLNYEDYFHNNFSSSCDVGWMGLDVPAKSCIKFAGFIAHKNRNLGFSYVGNSKEIIVHDMKFLDNRIAISTNIASNGEANPEVFYENLEINIRAYAGTEDLYIGKPECESNGILSPVFLRGQFDYNFKESQLPLFKPLSNETQAGEIYLRRIYLQNFHYTECGQETEPVISHPIKANNDYFGNSIFVFLDHIQMGSTMAAFSDLIYYDYNTSSYDDNSICKTTLCTGSANVLFLEFNPDFQGDKKIIRNHFSNKQKTINNDYCNENTEKKLITCSQMMALLSINIENGHDPNLFFPANISVNKKTNGTPEFTNSIFGEKSASAVVKPLDVNDLWFNHSLSRSLSFRFQSPSESDWIILSVSIDPSFSISVYHQDTKIERSPVTGDTVDLSSLGSCGQHIVDSDNSRVHLHLTSVESCRASLKFTKSVSTSILFDQTLDLFSQNTQIEKLKTFISYSLKIPLNSNRVNIKQITGDPVKVEFEIETDATNSENPRTYLTQLFCDLNERVSATTDIDGVSLLGSLGLATLFIGEDTPEVLKDPCGFGNPDPNSPCSEYEPNTTDCKSCKQDFALDRNSKECLLSKCQLFDQLTKQCEKCIPGYWLDKPDFNSCKSVTEIYQCETYKTLEDACEVCGNGRELVGNKCMSIQSPVIWCAKYVQDGECLQCEDGFDLVKNKCVAENCSDSDDSSHCTQCDDGFYLTPKTDQPGPTDICVKHSPLLNCQTLSGSSDTCQTCSFGYKLDDSGQCVYNFCAEFDDRNQCVKCQNNRTLLSLTNACVELELPIEFCTNYQTDSLCQECEEGYYLETSNKCTPYSEGLNCQGFDKNANRCETCFDFHVLRKGKCVDVSNCDQKGINDENECTSCREGSYLDGERKTCTLRTITNCGSFLLDKDECESCTEYHRLVDGVCRRLTHCSQFEKNQRGCAKCDDSHFLDEETKMCHPRTAQNCETVDPSNDKCLSCELKFFLSGDSGGCRNVTEVEDCVVYEAHSDQCKYCRQQTYFTQGQCKPVSTPSENCKFYDRSMQCAICEEMHYLSDNKRCNEGNLPGCFVYESETRCSACEGNRYYLNEDKQCNPYSSDLNCREFHLSRDVCTKCPDFHRLDSSGKCVYLSGCIEVEELSKSDCKRCEREYYLDRPTKTCKPRSAPNCLEVDPEKDECVSCINMHWKDTTDSNRCKQNTRINGCVAYKKNQNKCKYCYRAFFYNVQNNTCERLTKVVSNCHVFAGDGQCEVCEDNFVRVQSETTQCILGDILGCKHYQSITECVSCHEGYFLESQSKCTKYSSNLNCKERHPTRNQCTQCHPKKKLDESKKCVQIEGCITFESDFVKCKQCREEYVLDVSSKECVLRVSENCDLVKPDIDQCETCRRLFYKDEAGSCNPVTMIGHCVEYRPDQDGCLKCDDLTYEEEGDCLPFQTEIENCRIYFDEKTCQSCANTFYLQENQCKPGQIENCIEYHSQEICKSCLTGYYLVGNKQCEQYSVDLTCQEYHPHRNECVSCLERFKMKESKVCEQITNCRDFSRDLHSCELCNANHYKDENSNECIPRTNLSCKFYNPKRDQCETCHSNKYLDIEDSYKCKARLNNQNCRVFHPSRDFCLECAPNLIFADGICLDQNMKIALCLVYNLDRTCKHCEDGYYYNDSDRKCMPDNCTRADESSECVECEKGYFLGRGPDICVKYTDHRNCQELEEREDKCGECSFGFVFDLEGACVKDRCIAYGTQRVCVECEPDYAVERDSKKCVFLENNTCKVWDQGNQKCLICREKFYLNEDAGDECYKVNEIENCSAYKDNLNECRECEVGHTLQNGKCFESIEYCLEYLDSGQCAHCEEGKELLNSTCFNEDCVNTVFQKQLPKFKLYQNLLFVFVGVSILLILLIIVLVLFIFKCCCFKKTLLYGQNRGKQGHPRLPGRSLTAGSISDLNSNTTAGISMESSNQIRESREVSDINFVETQGQSQEKSGQNKEVKEFEYRVRPLSAMTNAPLKIN